LFYGARRPDLLIYRQQVEQAAAACPALQVRCLAEEADSAGAGLTPTPITSTIPGRLDLGLVWREAGLGHCPPDAARFSFYLSGPPVMLQALSAGLRERGADPARIFTDAWE
jgi:ferredoxin-NADP reductase